MGLVFLEEQLAAVQGKIDLVDGAEMSFDEETRVLYGVVLPPFDEARYRDTLNRLGQLLPGQGDIGTRLSSYLRRFAVPRNKTEESLNVAIAQYRKWTLEHIQLPAEEGFDLEFVYGKPWRAYQTYKGHGRSRLQVNVAGELLVDDLELVAGHEIYPGHHTHVVLLDTHLYRGRGWVEFSVVPLDSPLTLVAEGIAEYGYRDLVASPQDRGEFRRQVLFPMLGIDPKEVGRYEQVVTLASESWGPRAEAARLYLDGTMASGELMLWIREHQLTAPGAEYAVIGGIRAMRSYLITYSMGRTVLSQCIASRVGPNARAAGRWELFQRLLSTPQCPGTLKPIRRQCD